MTLTLNKMNGADPWSEDADAADDHESSQETPVGAATSAAAAHSVPAALAEPTPPTSSQIHAAAE